MVENSGLEVRTLKMETSEQSVVILYVCPNDGKFKLTRNLEKPPHIISDVLYLSNFHKSQ